jgi:hypothetical protein
VILRTSIVGSLLSFEEGLAQRCLLTSFRHEASPSQFIRDAALQRMRSSLLTMRDEGSSRSYSSALEPCDYFVGVRMS